VTSMWWAVSDRDYEAERDRYNEPAGRVSVQGRCEKCTAPAVGSFPGHVFCREHFLEHQAKTIADIQARAQRRVS
jgi:hypothetical protein